MGDVPLAIGRSLPENCATIDLAARFLTIVGNAPRKHHDRQGICKEQLKSILHRSFKGGNIDHSSFPTDSQ